MVRAVIVLAMVMSVAPSMLAASGMSPRNLYILRCSGCHGMSGAGNLSGGIPPFPDVVGVFTRAKEGRRYLANVPGVLGSSLSAGEIAAVLNFVLETWAGPSLDAGHLPFDEAEVSRYITQPVPDPVALRREIDGELQVKGIALPEYPWP